MLDHIVPSAVALELASGFMGDGLAPIDAVVGASA